MIHRHMVVTAVLLVVLVPLTSAQDPCVVPDDAGGTVTLPPAGCEYLSPDEVHLILDGLPIGVTIEAAPIHRDFLCGSYAGYAGTECPPPGICEEPGGALGGNVDCFESEFALQLTGVGPGFDTYSRTLTVPFVLVQVQTGPRTPGDAVQTFNNEMVSLSGSIDGDPDFQLLEVIAGQANGLPVSTGQTTLTRLGPPGSSFNVESFFDVAYRIHFIGAPGSILDGLEGSTTATVHMVTGQPPVQQPVPAMSPWSNVVLAVLLLVAGVATLLLVRRQL